MYKALKQNKSISQLKIGDEIKVVETSDRPTILIGIIKELPRLKPNPVWGTSYYSIIEVEGIKSDCRLTY